MMNKNVLIVDDHAVMRKGMKAILNNIQGGLNIFESCDADTMLEHFKQRKIDVLIMDIHIPNTDSIGLVELITIKYPSTYTLVFSMLPEHIYGRRLLKAGAKGYLPKESDIDQIKHAFDQVFNQKTYLSPMLSQVLDTNAPQQVVNPFSGLSHREFEIVNLLLSGCGISQIAQKLNLKHSTVGTYKTRIFDKLHVRTIFELKDLAILYNFNHHTLDERITGKSWQAGS